MYSSSAYQRVVNIIDTADVLNYNALVSNQLNQPSARNAINNIEASLLAIEKKVLENSTYLAMRNLKELADNIYKLDVNAVKSLVRRNFYDPELMKEILNVMSSIVYLQPNTPGAVNPNERVKQWLKNLQRIGSESAKGFAFKGDLRMADAVFVIKTPRTPREDLIHELVVGLEINKLRSYVPNFAYVFGGFKCTPPILKDIIAGLPGLPLGSGKSESIPVSWCDNSNRNVVQYIIYENIVPAVSMNEYVSKCTFTEFLDKYLQIIFALLVLQKVKGGSHNDLHGENVLIKQNSGGKISIPYTTELGTVEYLETDGIATIIDYGFTHLKLDDGTPVGPVGYENLGMFYDKFIPIHDAYKLLMAALFSMLRAKNFSCYQKAAQLYRFFNMTEDVNQVVTGQQARLSFMTPYNEKTISVKLEDFISFIRRNIPEYNLIMSSSPKTRRVLGCTGNDVCLSSEGAIEVLGFNSKKVIDNIFDFYDIVSRLEQEGRTADIQEVVSTTDPNFLFEDGVIKYNEDIAKIQEYFNIQNREVMTIQGIDLNLLRTEPVRSNYKNFLLDTAEINESFQRLSLIYDCIIFLSKYFSIDTTDVQENYNIMMEYYADLLLILDVIKGDALELGPKLIAELQLPELEVLSKNIN